MKKSIRPYFALFIPVILIIALDQYTKFLVETNLAYGAIWSPWEWLVPYARVIHWTNTGVAFGLFQGVGWFSAIFAVAVSVGVVYYFPHVEKADWAIHVALILEMAGALGNMIDRFRLNGAVLDFISVGNFPVFNVADASITVGVAFLALGILLQDRRSKKNESLKPEAGNTLDNESGKVS